MEWNQLQSFLEVARQGSISRAAHNVHLTQSAVTKQISALETELATRLFHRTGRGVELTQAGLVLRDYVQRSEALLDECRNVIDDLESGAAGQLLLGAGGTTSIFQLPGWLRSLQELLPGLDVVVRTGDSREVERLVLHREVDLGLVTSPVQHPALQVVPLYEEEIVLVVPQSYPATRRKIRPADASFYPLILFPRGSGFRDYLDVALSNAGIEMQVKMESDSVEAVKSFVAVGLGASFLPLGAVAAEIESGAMKRVEVTGLAGLQRTTAVIRRTDRYLGAGARTMLQILDSRYRVNSMTPSENSVDDPDEALWPAGDGECE